MVRLRHTLLCILALPGTLFAAGGDNGRYTGTRAFDPAFRTLKLQVEGDFFAPAVIPLDGDRRIIFTFDEMGDNYSDLRYRLVHCDADWQPSDLVDSEFVEGFNFADVDDYAFSSNTFVHFVNYRITIPSENLRPTLSGNYLIEVFERDNPDDTLLQGRFSISEDSAFLGGEVSSRTDRGLNTEWQQLQLTLSSGNNNPAGAPLLSIANPYTDIKVTVSQNDTPETTRTLPPPSRIEGSRLVWQHLPELIYPGGNEFRRFETVRVNYPGMHVDSMRYHELDPAQSEILAATTGDWIADTRGLYYAYLLPDLDRSEAPYHYDSTQGGRFLIRESNATDSDLGADYLMVRFALISPEYTNADIFIDGEFTHYLRSEAERMTYEDNLGTLPDGTPVGGYTLTLPLKQGAYNYRYVAIPAATLGAPLPTGDPKSDHRHILAADPAPIEGNHHETSNEYQLRAYYRPPGARYDRLIATARLRP